MENAEKLTEETQHEQTSDIHKNKLDSLKGIAKPIEALKEKTGSTIEFAKEKATPRAVKRVFFILFILMLIGVGAFIAYNYFVTKRFKDFDSFREYVQSFGWGGPIFLTVFQAIKVIYAIIPGAIGCCVGASVFGPVVGFICNYVGICIGSIAAFWISKTFGESFMRQIFSEKQYKSGLKWMRKLHRSYNVFLWIAICSPIAPDDFLCYFTGLTTMTKKRFIILLLTAKIWTILGYSLIFGNVI